MHSKYYKFNDTVIRVITPVKIVNSEPYSQFLCDECKADFTVEYSFSELLPEIPDNAVEGTDITVYNELGVQYCWYKNHGAEGCYACRIFSEKSKKVILLSDFREKLWNRVVFDLLGFEELMSDSQKAVIHASYIIKNGSAILFTAPSGTGKSTQAMLWEKYADAEIVNGDKAMISRCDENIVACGLPFSGSSGFCRNITAPIKAVVCLAQAKENKLCRLSSSDAFVLVLTGCYLPVGNPDSSSGVIDIINQICDELPVYKFECLPDESSVRVLENELCL